MISIEDKLNVFRQDLRSQVQLEREEKVGQAREQAEQDLEMADLQIARQKEQIEERFKRQTQRNVAKIIAEGKNKAKDMVLDLERELSENFIESISLTALDYLDSNLYKNYLKKSILEIKKFFPNDRNLTVFLNDKDREFFSIVVEEYLKGYQFQYEKLEPKKLGGFQVRGQDGRVNYDFSIADLLEDKQNLSISKLREIMKGDLD